MNPSLNRLLRGELQLGSALAPGAVAPQQSVLNVRTVPVDHIRFAESKVLYTFASVPGKGGLHARGSDADKDGKTGEGKKGRGFWKDKNKNKKPDGMEGSSSDSSSSSDEDEKPKKKAKQGKDKK